MNLTEPRAVHLMASLVDVISAEAGQPPTFTLDDWPLFVRWGHLRDDHWLIVKVSLWQVEVLSPSLDLEYSWSAGCRKTDDEIRADVLALVAMAGKAPRAGEKATG